MILYVYAPDTLRVTAEIHAEYAESCESVVAERFGDTDYFEATYTPAFGCVDGLVSTDHPEIIDARNHLTFSP
jgi:hypothetical protein